MNFKALASYPTNVILVLCLILILILVYLKTHCFELFGLDENPDENPNPTTSLSLSQKLASENDSLTNFINNIISKKTQENEFSRKLKEQEDIIQLLTQQALAKINTAS